MASTGETGLKRPAELHVGVFGGRAPDLRPVVTQAAGVPSTGAAPVALPRRRSRLLPVSAAALLVTSAVLFGSVHPWAYWPVGAAVVALSVWSMLRSSVGPLGWRTLTPAALLLLPVLFQAAPLPGPWLDAISPATMTSVRSLQVGVDAASHSISIAPALTLTAFCFLLVGAMWTGAFARALGHAMQPSVFVRALMAMSIVLALFALIQKATFNGKIYWFWESEFGVTQNYFGPFVNRNHFAGWMLLATALSAGHLLGFVSAAGRPVKPGWRHRVLWLGTPEASLVMLTAVGVAIMATSLVWSLSRSGVAGAFLAFVVLAVAAVRRMRSRTQARMALLGILVLIASVAAWRGLDTIAASYGDTRTLEWRFDLWRDSLPPLRTFYAFGAGLNSYGRLMLLYPQTDVQVHAQQAHNDYLQLAIEGGALVIIPWLIALLILARRVVRAFGQPQDDQTWWIRMGAVAGIAGIALQELTEFSLQIPAVALLFATALAIALHKPAAPSAAPSRAGSRSRHR